MFAAVRNVDLENLAPLIRRNIEIKSKIVAKDEHDRTGERALLNFGHTVGHAIERAGDYKKFLHGEAISLGIVAACDVSVKKAGLPRDQRNAIVDLLHRRIYRRIFHGERFSTRFSTTKNSRAEKFASLLRRQSVRRICRAT